MQESPDFSRTFGAALLVSGTTIGAGMLAFPITTGLAGFFPSLLLFFSIWLLMIASAFLFLEALLWFPNEVNLLTLVRSTLGKSGTVIAWSCYLFLLYALTTAYLAGAGPIVREAVSLTTGWAMPAWAGAIPILLIFGLCICRGTATADQMNRWLMAGLAITYLLIVVLLADHVEPTYLEHEQWSKLPIAVSIIATSFGFHIVIPTLVSYLHRNVKKLSLAVICGSFSALVVYLIWEAIALGVVPSTGENGLFAAYQEGTNLALLLSYRIDNHWLAAILQLFAFFAILTSCLGVSLSLFDFLADAFFIEKSALGKTLLYLLTFLPPIGISWHNPRAFLSALEYAGAYGVAALLICLPALVVWRGRYHLELQGPFRVPGGAPLLLTVMVGGATIILLQIYFHCIGAVS